ARARPGGVREGKGGANQPGGIRSLLPDEAPRGARGRVGLAPECGRELAGGARRPVPGDRRSISRPRGPAPPELGRVSPGTGDGGVLEGTGASPPRPVPVHEAIGRRLGDRAALPLGAAPEHCAPDLRYRSQPMDDELRGTIAGLLPGVRADLERLVRIPSIAFPGYAPQPVRDSAEATAEIMAAAGLSDVHLIELPTGEHPAVFGQKPTVPGAPAALLYPPHALQPQGPVDDWDTPPFEPTVRDGRMYGRGTSDDKCGIVLHAAALKAFGGAPPATGT